MSRMGRLGRRDARAAYVANGGIDAKQTPSSAADIGAKRYETQGTPLPGESASSLIEALRGLARVLGTEVPLVAVLADATTAPVEEAARAFGRERGADVVLISPEEYSEWPIDETSVRWLRARNFRAVHRQMLATGPFDAIIDMLGVSLERAEEPFAKLFFHLKPRGWYFVVSPRPDEANGRTRALIKTTRAFLDTYTAGGDGELPGGRLGELVASTAQISVDRTGVLIQKRHRHYAKLRDSNVARFLPTRNEATTVEAIETVKGGVLTAMGAVTHHGAPAPVAHMASSLEYPEANLLRYKGEIYIGSNSLLYSDASILPASYRYPTAPTLANPRIVQADRDFARIPQQVRAATSLDGSYYHLDCWHSGHFGHIMSEVVSRMWGWHRAKADDPSIKAIFRRRFPNERKPVIEKTLFEAFGIPSEDIVWVDEPVRINSIVTGSSLWQNVDPYFVNPLITQTWARLRDGLTGGSAGDSTKIFVSRRAERHGNRTCRNAAEVETIFAHHGFSIVYPEDFSHHEQAAIFANARVVAGFAGSALYNVILSSQISTLIVLTHHAYTARYEHLMSLALGFDTHYFWGDPDVSHPKDGWSEEAYYSSWEFPLAALGEELAGVLESI
ncbi:glycosyltransferase 61 family protein [Isoptericola sp. NPDC019482]|uniref:glycosyltransferase family 61 protein n=1 Tax=Isoptericola sp. NPDC019482 TaxID=3154688 RepID=UPI00348C9CA9